MIGEAMEKLRHEFQCVSNIKFVLIRGIRAFVLSTRDLGIESVSNHGNEISHVRHTFRDWQKGSAIGYVNTVSVIDADLLDNFL